MKQNKNQSNLISLGTLGSTHGLKGEIKVHTQPNILEKKFKKNTSVFFFDGQEQKELVIENSSLFFPKITLKFKGIDRIEDVQFLKGKEIFKEKKELNLEKEEFLIKDLIGFNVANSSKNIIGVVKSFWIHGPYYNLDILFKENDKIFNVPFISEFIEEIDSRNKTVYLKNNYKDLIS